MPGREESESCSAGLMLQSTVEFLQQFGINSNLALVHLGVVLALEREAGG